jgi:NAD(P)H-flavin reductase
MVVEAEKTAAGQVRVVRVKVPRAIPTRPGSYFYLYRHGIPFRGRLAPVVWWDRNSKNSSREFTFILDDEWLGDLRQGSEIILDGPYGKEVDARKYQTILLVAIGKGICGILPVALSILSGHASGGYGTLAKLDIFWKLESRLDFQWASTYFEQLETMKLNVSELTFPQRN